MTLNLMPAELVAKIAEDEFSRFLGCGEDDLEPTTQFKLAVRHAWIVAAEWHDEYADHALRKGRLASAMFRVEDAEFHAGEMSAHRDAARALRQAAREDVEP